MNIFLSWSGDKSHQVATALVTWLPSVLPNLKVFLSSQSIGAGERWNHELARQLETCSFGIVLVTRENQSSGWLLYEAGALSKAVDTSRVIPLLLNLGPHELRQPLAQFQCATTSRQDILRVLRAIAGSDPATHVEESALANRLEVWWPHIEQHFRIADSRLIPVHSTRRTLVKQGSPWLEDIVSSDPQNASFAIGDAVVFDQATFGTGYRPENIRISYTDAPYSLPKSIEPIARRYRAIQIGRNLPHYAITSFKHSEIDYPEVLLTLSRCWYMDIRSIQAALQDNPGQPAGDAGNTLIDVLLSMAPLDLNRSPLPSQLSANVAVIAQEAGEDPYLILVQRGPPTQVGYYPEAWSVSLQETMSAGGGVHADDAHEPDTTIQACAMRGVREELLGPRADCSVELHSFFIEAPLLNQSVMAIARVPLSFAEVCQRRRILAADSRESGLVCGLPCRPEQIVHMLDADAFDFDYVRTVGLIDPHASTKSLTSGRLWHPASKLALYSVLRRYFPNHAQDWLVANLSAS